MDEQGVAGRGPGGGTDDTRSLEQKALDAEHVRRHENPTAEEIARQEECLRIQNDVRLSASEKRWKLARVAKPGVLGRSP